MPCHTEGPTAEEAYEYYEKKLRHNSPVADALCELCASLDESKLTPKAAMWWREHKERDRKRLQAEMKEAERAKDKATALARLSPYERKLLNI